MNKYPIRLLTALLICSLFFAGCNKNTVKPIVKATGSDYSALSSQIGTSLYKSLTGQYGGTDISKGIRQPFSIKNNGRNGLSVFDINPLCGFVVDTAYNYRTKSGDPLKNDPLDTLFVHTGDFNFKYTCDADAPNGYIVTDTVALQASTILYTGSNTVGQHYTVKALDQTFKLVSMEGSINTGSSQVTDEGTRITTLTASYTLTGLKVDFTSGLADITTGTSNFQMAYVPVHSIGQLLIPTYYQGTIEYLGNHMVKLTINPGHVYMVNLLTGVATPV